MQLKIMTYNVQHFKNYREEAWDLSDYGMFSKYISEKNPDIIGMNEVRGEGKHPAYINQTDTVAKAAGYGHAVFAPAVMVNGTDPYGNALLSHFPFEAESIPIPLPEGRTEAECEPRGIINASFNINVVKLCVLVTHFGLTPEEAENAVKAICGIADTVTDPIIVMGDFNLTPDSDILLPLRERLYDTASELCGDGFTFPSDFPERKIDYIFTRGLKVLEARVCGEAISDHRAIEAVVEL